MSVAQVTRSQVLGFRVRAQQLDRSALELDATRPLKARRDRRNVATTQAGQALRVQVELWETVSSSIREAISEQAERLAAYRQVPLSGIDLAGALT